MFHYQQLRNILGWQSPFYPFCLYFPPSPPFPPSLRFPKKTKAVSQVLLRMTGLTENACILTFSGWNYNFCLWNQWWTTSYLWVVTLQDKRTLPGKVILNLSLTVCIWQLQLLSCWCMQLTVIYVIYFPIWLYCHVYIKAVAFLPKTVCNIKDVEFARAVKLNKTSIDLITFQVPRVKVSTPWYCAYFLANTPVPKKEGDNFFIVGYRVPVVKVYPEFLYRVPMVKVHP